MATINVLPNELDYFTGVIRTDYAENALARGIFEKTYNVGEYTISPHYFERTRTDGAQIVGVPNKPIGGGARTPEALKFDKKSINMVMIYKDWMINKNELEGARISGMDLELLFNTDIGQNMSDAENNMLINGDSEVGIDGFVSVSGKTSATPSLDWDGATVTNTDIYNFFVDLTMDLKTATNQHRGPFTLLLREEYLAPLLKITDYGINTFGKLNTELGIKRIITSNDLPTNDKIYLMDTKKKNMALAQGIAPITKEYDDNIFDTTYITYQTVGTFFFDPTAIVEAPIDGS